MHRYLIIALVALGGVMTMTASAFAVSTATVTVKPPRETAGASQFVAGAKPPASAKLRSCVSSPYYEGRRIVFRGTMSRFSDTAGLGSQKLEMRFDVYRKVNENKRFKRLRAEGLGEWLSSTDPAATAYQREIVLENMETAAQYRAKVSYRWISPSGSVEWRRHLTTKVCKQKASLPRLGVQSIQWFPMAGTANNSFKIVFANRGGSEAEAVPFEFSVDGGAPQQYTVDSIPARNLFVEAIVTGPACTSRVDVKIDPLRRLRLQPGKGRSFGERPGTFTTC